MYLEKSWSYKENFPVNFYYNNGKNRIILTEGFLTHNINWITKIKDTDFVFCFAPCHFNIHLLNMELEILNEYNLNKDKIYFLLGTEQDVKLCKTKNINAEFINHNAFLDENLFTLEKHEKFYDAILISRFLKLKRPFLASKIKNLCILSADVGDKTKDDFFDLNILKPKYLGVGLKQEDVFNKIKESYCGLFLSEKEGACFASSETLLCGVPVVSTLSEGGREVWYNKYNSIICENNEDSIEECVEKAKENIKRKIFDPWYIRNLHIAQMNYFRFSFIELTKKIFNIINVNIDIQQYFYSKFHHKMFHHYHKKQYIKSIL